MSVPGALLPSSPHGAAVTDFQAGSGVSGTA